MAVLHILPTFATGGLGACALNMIRGWPVKTEHYAVAPQFWGQATPMLPTFEQVLGRERVAVVPRPFMMKQPEWAEALGCQITEFAVHAGHAPGGWSHVIQYNVLDLLWTYAALDKVGYTGRVLAHVGTTLHEDKATREIFPSPLNARTRFIPVHRGVDAATRKLGVNPQLVEKPVWNAVDLDKFDASARTRALTFGFAARMSKPEQKNWGLLLTGFAEAQIPGSTLRLAGDGPGRGDIERVVRELGIESKVEFCGNLTPPAMPGFYRSLDVFVMASHAYEGFANALSEGFASRCLMLATDVPGCREPFEAGDGARFLAPDASTLARLMRDLQRPDVRAENIAFVERVRPMLAAENMARAYYEIGL